MQKKHIIAIIALAAVFVIYFGVRGIGGILRRNREEAAWKLYMQAEEKYSNEQYKEALSLCEQAEPNLYSPDKKASCLALMAELHGKQNQIITAQEIFRRAIKLKPDDYHIRMKYGKTIYNIAGKKDINQEKTQDELRLALRQFNDAYDFCPRFKRRELQDILFYQADILEMLKLFELAEQKYKEMIEIGRNYPDDQSEYFNEAVRRLNILERE